MTRINCIPPKCLTDQHLFSEWREITRVSNLAKIVPNAPERYKLGEGHLKFFYDKGYYLSVRLSTLETELRARSTVNFTSKTYVLHPQGLNKPWTPTLEDKITCLYRLHNRLLENISYYSYYNVRVTSTFYSSQLEHLINVRKSENSQPTRNPYVRHN